MQSPKFNKLPLIEVAQRLSLAGSLEPDLDAMFAIREALRVDFPAMELGTTLESPPGLVGSIRVQPPLLFGGRPDGHSLLVQDRLLALRWKSGPAPGRSSEGLPYPGFDVGFPLLQKATSVISHVAGTPLEVAVVNMSYANFIDRATDDAATVLRSHFVDGLLPSILPLDGRLQGSAVHWGGPDGIDVAITLGEAVGGSPETRRAGVVVTTAAGKVLGQPVSDFAAEMALVHDRLQVLFTGIITAHANEVWDRVS